MERVGSVLWRALKVMPIVGYVFVIASAPHVVRRKGYVFGTLAVTLDLLPLVCFVKAGVEVFTGDLLPDKDEVIQTSNLKPAA
jgi:hypothetical protein